VIELAQLRWFGHVVRIGDERYPRMAWEEGIQKILKEARIEWNCVRDAA
jgi:hypothetical protein